MLYRLHRLALAIGLLGIATLLAGCGLWENIKESYTWENMLIGAGIGLLLAVFGGISAKKKK